MSAIMSETGATSRRRIASCNSLRFGFGFARLRLQKGYAAGWRGASARIQDSVALGAVQAPAVMGQEPAGDQFSDVLSGDSAVAGIRALTDQFCFHSCRNFQLNQSFRTIRGDTRRVGRHPHQSRSKDPSTSHNAIRKAGETTSNPARSTMAAANVQSHGKPRGSQPRGTCQRASSDDPAITSLCGDCALSTMQLNGFASPMDPTADSCCAGCDVENTDGKPDSVADMSSLPVNLPLHR